METYDAIIVGAGGSGLAAALSVAQAGGSVVVIEKQPQPGGTTGIAVGSFTAAGTSLQRQAGIEDTAADHATDAGRFPPADLEARNNTELRARFLSEAAATFEWLRRLGLQFQGPNPEPPNRVARMHNVIPGAKAYIAAFQQALQRYGGAVLCRWTVTELIRENDRVVGVRAERDGKTVEFRARRGVVLAAGDYANGGDLIRRYKGEGFEAVEGINPHATGDGHRLIEQAGGTLCNMDITYGPELRFISPARRPFQQLLPTGRWSGRVLGAIARHLPRSALTAITKRLLVTWQHPEDALFHDGAILINARGERFTNERVAPQRELAVAQQPDKACYILLDGRLVERYSAWPHFISTAPDIAYAYVRDYQRLRPDVTKTASSLEALAASRGLDRSRLAETVRCFSANVVGEGHDPFGRAGDEHPLANPPWVLLGPAKAYFTTTEGGAVIDEYLRVHDDAGRPIPGLYAVGQNGLGGMVLWGHGLHIAWALTSGRLVGAALMSR